MSKKHKKFAGQTHAADLSRPTAGLTHAAEYRVIKHDLVKVVVLNVVYLALILAVYFENLRSHFLDNWFARVLHF